MIELLIQGALAAILLLGMIAVVVIELAHRQPVNVPDALTLSVGMVVGFFFGARSVAGPPTPPPPPAPATKP